MSSSPSPRVILFGAAAVGRFFARRMHAAGNPPVAFADNDPAKQRTTITVGGVAIPVLSPRDARTQFPAALWVPTVMQQHLIEQVTEEIAILGVHTSSLWEYVPERGSDRARIPAAALQTLFAIAGDAETRAELVDQELFRRTPDVRRQRPAGDVEECYFPEWIGRSDAEVFWDVGANIGDTVLAFTHRWKNWKHITAFEPDRATFQRLRKSVEFVPNVECQNLLVLDISEEDIQFVASGDGSAHIANDEEDGECVDGVKLDDVVYPHDPPTYIKLDIEGSEPSALWGARNLIREHAPVIAVCAYHEPEHLWSLPLLLHALNPSYKLYLRRYMPGTWELIYYAVPPDRIVHP